MRLSPRPRLLLQVLVVTVVLAFWARAVWDNWGQVSRVQWQANPLLLAASACLALAHLPLTALIWRKALQYVGIQVTVRWALKSYLLTQLGRYIPGGVWDVAGRLVAAGDEGLPKGPVSVTILVEMALGVVTGALIFLASLAFWDRAVPVEGVAAAAAMVAAGLAALHPALLGPLLGLAARVLRRDTAVLPMNYGQVLTLALYHFLVRLLVGVAFYFFAAALTPLGWDLLPVFAGIFVASWVLGFVVVLAPQGLGVREGAMVLLMSFFLPLAVASVIAVGFRLWLSLRDLAMAGVGARL